MSLLKQLFLAICLFLVVAFSGSFVSSVENSREQLRGQLRSHAQDAATALGLSLTPHVDDPAMVQLMVSSIFDSGYFASIRVVDLPEPAPAKIRASGWRQRIIAHCSSDGGLTTPSVTACATCSRMARSWDSSTFSAAAG